jgi:signal transduction histidine kinase
MIEARAFLNEAIARLDELSDIDQARLKYLEQRSITNQETNEDLFHTANNALFVISVNLDLLTRHFLATSECQHPEVPKWLALLLQKTNEIAMLNRLLLGVGTGENRSPLYLIHSFISFRAAIQRAIDTYEDIAREKQITIHWEMPDFPAIAIWSDGVAIGTVLDNLLSNAVKFSQPGRTVHVTATRTDEDLICSVRDEGPGLSEADLARLFERGVHLEPKPTGGETSSGYGLAVARGVAESLGGRLWCKSVQGEGSCFFFSLPRSTGSRG